MGRRKTYAEMTKEEIITAEKKKLSCICGEMDGKTRKAVDSLMDEAAFMSASFTSCARS